MKERKFLKLFAVALLLPFFTVVTLPSATIVGICGVIVVIDNGPLTAYQGDLELEAATFTPPGQSEITSLVETHPDWTVVLDDSRTSNIVFNSALPSHGEAFIHAKIIVGTTTYTSQDALHVRTTTPVETWPEPTNWQLLNNVEFVDNTGQSTILVTDASTAALD